MQTEEIFGCVHTKDVTAPPESALLWLIYTARDWDRDREMMGFYIDVMC